MQFTVVGTIRRGWWAASLLVMLLFAACANGSTTASDQSDLGSATDPSQGPIHYLYQGDGVETFLTDANNFRLFASNLKYHKGPTMRTNSVTYAIFWVPSGSTMSSGYQDLIQRFFGDIGGSNLYKNVTQYYDTVGGSKQNIQNKSSFGGAWVDTSAYPSATLSDQQVQQEVVRARQANSGWKSDINHVFFVFTAQSEAICDSPNVCSTNVFCGYHSYSSAKDIYAVIPYPGTGCTLKHSPNNNVAADSALDITSHEMFESITDPQPGSGWFTPIRQGEIGDLCAHKYAPLDAQNADVTLNGHPYLVQTEWSNKQGKCVIAGP